MEQVMTSTTAIQPMRTERRIRTGWWTFRPLALAVTAVFALAAAPSTAAAGSDVRRSDVGSFRATASLGWQQLPTGSTEDYRGVKAVSRKVVWVAGTGGEVLRTIDGGHTWKDVSPPGAETHYFRDIEATSARHAVLMSVASVEGDPAGQHVYVTDDGGVTWASSLVNTDPNGFFDCMAFSSASHGYLLADPVDGKFQIFLTRDAGHHWRLADLAGMPVVPDGEFGFAAGGTCMSAVGSHVWFGTGGLATTHVLLSRDNGRTWTAYETPVTGVFPAVFAAQFRDRRNGIAVGGDLNDLDRTADSAAWSADGGLTWHEPSSFPAGLRTAAVWLPHLPIALAVGPTGSDISLDAGRSWHAIDANEWNTVSCSADLACYAVGNAGLVAHLTIVP
jgi:photosystem II stability/assembly factor-like uncharacterized protein